MTYSPLDSLVAKIASLNGTGKEELERRVREGDLSEVTAGFVLSRAYLLKIEAILDSMEEKTDEMLEEIAV